MNEAVDLNETRFLCLVIVLAADICYQYKDFKRSFYFYHQSVNLRVVRKCFLPMRMCSMWRLRLLWRWEISVWSWSFTLKRSKSIRRLYSTLGKQKISKISCLSMTALAVPTSTKVVSKNHNTIISDSHRENSKAMTLPLRKYQLKCSSTMKSISVLLKKKIWQVFSCNI